MNVKLTRNWFVALVAIIILFQGGFWAGWWPWGGLNQPLVTVCLIFAWWLPLRVTILTLLTASIVLESMAASVNFGLLLVIGVVMCGIVAIQSAGWQIGRRQLIFVVAAWLSLAYGVELIRLDNSLQPVVLITTIIFLIVELLLWRLVIAKAILARPQDYSSLKRGLA